MNYDPNLTNSGRMAKQTVRLTFAQWEYRKTIETEVGGNCTGLTVIECAVDNVYDSLPRNRHDCAYLEMGAVDGSGDTLICEDDEDSGDEWLKDMLVCAEIVAIRPDER
jgi:hypothetical protein